MQFGEITCAGKVEYMQSNQLIDGIYPFDLVNQIWAERWGFSPGEVKIATRSLKEVIDATFVMMNNDLVSLRGNKREHAIINLIMEDVWKLEGANCRLVTFYPKTFCLSKWWEDLNVSRSELCNVSLPWTVNQTVTAYNTDTYIITEYHSWN